MGGAPGRRSLGRRLRRARGPPRARRRVLRPRRASPTARRTRRGGRAPQRWRLPALAGTMAARNHAAAQRRTRALGPSPSARGCVGAPAKRRAPPKVVRRLYDRLAAALRQQLATVCSSHMMGAPLKSAKLAKANRAIAKTSGLIDGRPLAAGARACARQGGAGQPASRSHLTASAKSLSNATADSTTCGLGQRCGRCVCACVRA